MRRASVKSAGLLACLFIPLFAATQFHAKLLFARWGDVPLHAVWQALAIAAWAVGAMLVCRLKQLLVWNQVGRRNP